MLNYILHMFIIVKSQEKGVLEAVFLPYIQVVYERSYKGLRKPVPAEISGEHGKIKYRGCYSLN
jgi:hypothetical protein